MGGSTECQSRIVMAREELKGEHQGQTIVAFELISFFLYLQSFTLHGSNIWTFSLLQINQLLIHSLKVIYIEQTAPAPSPAKTSYPLF
jgi:hypothetical protein